MDTLGTEEGSASRFPFITLEKAIDRALELRKSTGDHAAPIAELPAIWKYAQKASGWKQTIAALKYYGLITDSGTKDRRSIKLTDDARRFFLDERPEAKEDIIRKFALSPRAFATLWKEWKAAPPTADNVARTTLKLKFGYAENAAPEVLRIYKANLAFAKLADAADDSPSAAPARDAEPSQPNAPPSRRRVRLVDEGRYVQWTSDGQEQFQIPKRVTWVSADGSHARVFGSMTGIPTSELTVVDPPKPGVHFVGKAADQVARERSVTEPGAVASATSEPPALNVLLHGNRLEISADVDRAGLQKLKTILAKYEEILALLEPHQD